MKFVSAVLCIAMFGANITSIFSKTDPSAEQLGLSISVERYILKYPNAPWFLQDFDAYSRKSTMDCPCGRNLQLHDPRICAPTHHERMRKFAKLMLEQLPQRPFTEVNLSQFIETPYCNVIATPYPKPHPFTQLRLYCMSCGVWQTSDDRTNRCAVSNTPLYGNVCWLCFDRSQPRQVCNYSFVQVCNGTHTNGHITAAVRTFHLCLVRLSCVYSIPLDIRAVLLQTAHKILARTCTGGTPAKK